MENLVNNILFAMRVVVENSNINIYFMQKPKQNNKKSQRNQSRKTKAKRKKMKNCRHVMQLELSFLLIHNIVFS